MSGTSLRQLHIGIFIYCLEGGGAQRRTVTLANGFAARGHRVDLIVVASQESVRVKLDPRIRLIGLDEGWRRWFEPLNKRINVRGWFTAGAGFRLARYLRDERPDVFLSAASHVNLVALCAYRAAGRPVPIVLRISNDPASNAARRSLPKRLLRARLGSLLSVLMPSADGIITVSNGVADNVARTFGVARERITTIYNPTITPELRRGLGAQLEHPWLAPGQPPVVLGVGRLKRQKDFATLIRAFARVRQERPARLVILGEGPKRQQLEELAASLGVATDVSLPGYESNPFAWMKRASVFVLSSAWEGLPGVLIEAMACGCPVVSTDCPSGPAEILDGGRYGPLVPVGDDAALAGAILATLEAPPAAAALEERTRLFEVDQAIDRYLEVLAATITQFHAQQART